ncbi:MAG: type IX secretion system membrane protein PorP/SprF [Cytophagaceae bacterium]|nr:type IX secretion system membrane protein PorP/SprF [Cytophagaceae bacterium]
MNYQYDPATATGEPVLGNGFGYVNVNAGGFWNFIFTPKIEFYAGISVYNLTSPKERAFVNLMDPNTLKKRSVFTGGMNYKLSERFSVLPTVLYMRQSGAVDLIAGSSVGYVMGNFTFLGGAYYRTIDALILIGGVKYKNYHLGLSYDATVSSLPDVKTAPNVDDDVKVGAFEISLIYTGFLKRPIPHNTSIPCRFF